MNTAAKPRGRPESWKCRKVGGHLTPRQRRRIVVAHAKVPQVEPRVLARELHCSIRTIHTWYARLAARAAELPEPTYAAAMPRATHIGMKPVCIRPECDRDAIEGKRVCERHVYRAPAHIPAAAFAGRA